MKVNLKVFKSNWCTGHEMPRSSVSLLCCTQVHTLIHSWKIILQPFLETEGITSFFALGHYDPAFSSPGCYLIEAVVFFFFLLWIKPEQCFNCYGVNVKPFHSTSGSLQFLMLRKCNPQACNKSFRSVYSCRGSSLRMVLHTTASMDICSWWFAWT